MTRLFTLPSRSPLALSLPLLLTLASAPILGCSADATSLEGSGATGASEPGGSRPGVGGESASGTSGTTGTSSADASATSAGDAGPGATPDASSLDASTPPGSDAGTPPVGGDAGTPRAATCGAAYVAPTWTLGTTYYFSSCATGSLAGCVPGDNNNAGTSASAPKRDLTGMDVNALPAGTVLRFARGGAWNDFRVVLRNLNVTTTSPLVFESYAPSWGGASPPRPVLHAQATGTGTFEFGTYQDTADDGGYVVRDFVVDGHGVAQWGFWLRDQLHDVLIDDVDVSGFKIGIYTSEASRAVTIRNSNIHDNESMGYLGGGTGTLIEGNTIAHNNFSGSGFNHGIYMGGSGAHARVRNNLFDRNSVVAGRCEGGNLTVHGQYDDVLIEGNTFVQDSSSGGCYGISINPGYATGEWFRNFVVRGNTVVNLGYCAICMTSAPGALVENNVVVNDQDTYQAGITIGAAGPSAGDEADTGAVVRNNTIFFSHAGNGSEGIGLRNAPGSNLVLASNLVYFGAASAAAHCFAHPGMASMTAFENNLCHHAGGTGSFSATYATQAAAAAAGVNAGGTDAAPAFVAAPSAGNAWSTALTAGSPAVNHGSATRSAPTDRTCQARVTPDIGASER